MSNKLNNSLLAVLSKTQRLLSADFTKHLKPLGITIDTWLTCEILEAEPGLSMTKIAEGLCLNLPTVTKLVDRMVSDNLVYRKPHHKDRRRVQIFMTDRGMTILSEARNIIQKNEAEVIAASDATIAALLSLLNKQENSGP